MKTVSVRQDLGIPGVYGLLLLDVVSRWGYSAESLFAPFHYTPEQLADPEFRIPLPIANDMIILARKMTSNQPYRPHKYRSNTCHGDQNFGAMSRPCPSICCRHPNRQQPYNGEKHPQDTYSNKHRYDFDPLDIGHVSP